MESPQQTGEQAADETVKFPRRMGAEEDRCRSVNQQSHDDSFL